MTIAVIAPTDPSIPKRPDGDDFYAALVSPDTSSIFADTLTEIVAELIPSYDNSVTNGSPGTDTDAAFVQRLDLLAELAAHRQALIAASATNQGRHFTEAELTALFTPKDQPAPVDGAWDDEDVPLLLLSTNYAPTTQHPLPTGDAVYVLDPSTELTFLQGFALLSGGELMIK